MTQTLPGINIGVQYIRYSSEYILKLQLHQQNPSSRSSDTTCYRESLNNIEIEQNKRENNEKHIIMNTNI